MTTPRNHHIISQVLIGNFVDENKNLFYYSKADKTIVDKKLHRFDFAEKDLNSILTKSGEIDHFSVEHTLDRHFETEFPKHYKKLRQAIETNDYSKVTPSIKYFLRMGIIGDMRTPEHQLETQEAIFGSFRKISQYATDDLKNSFLAHEQSLSGVKNKIPNDFKTIADNVSRLIGEKIYSIFLAPSDSYFFLPDCASVVFRAQLEDDTVIDGQVYYNPARPIATVIFPIDSKTILVVQSAKICPQPTNGIYKLSNDLVEKYNKMFLDQARDKVICRDKNYLNHFIGRHVSKT